MSNLSSFGNSAHFSQEEAREEHPVKHEEVLSEIDQALADASMYFGSRETSEHTEGLKILVRMMAKGYDVSSFAPLVVQECASSDPFGRQLAYIYLSHYADDSLESIVMSINAFQRSLSDSDPVCRFLALKTLSSISAPELRSIVKESIMQAAGDTSPYVRKAAAYAIVKASDVANDEQETEELLPALERLLKEDDPIGFSGAIAAYWSICPENVEFLHSKFRYMCQNIMKFDSWAQVYVLRSLAIYARYCFKNPSTQEDDASAFWDEETESTLNPDHILLLDAARKAMQSINPHVVLAAASLVFYCAPQSKVSCVARPLVRLIYEDDATTEVALSTIASIAAVYPHIFIPHISHFFVHVKDAFEVRERKLQILESLVNSNNVETILEELSIYACSSNTKFAVLAIKSILMISNKKYATPKCLTFLLKLLGTTEGKILSETILAVSQILKKNQGTTEEKTALKQLCRKFLVIKDPSAKAAVLCIVGEMHKVHNEFAPQLLRHIAKNFTEEPPEVRLMAITLAAKVIASGTDSKVPIYLIQLGERDNEFDVRDRAKFFKVLVSTKSEKMRAKLPELLFPQSNEQVNVERKSNEFLVGTLSHFLDKELPDYEGMPEWAPEDEIPDDSVRYPNGFVAEEEDDEEEHVNEKDAVMKFFADDNEDAEYEEAEEEEEAVEEEEEEEEEIEDNRPEIDEDDEDDFFS